MLIALAARCGVVAGLAAGMVGGAAFSAWAGEWVPPRVEQCYTLSTNPPVGPYDPEATVCRPN